MKEYLVGSMKEYLLVSMKKYLLGFMKEYLIGFMKEYLLGVMGIFGGFMKEYSWSNVSFLYSNAYRGQTQIFIYYKEIKIR